MANRIGQIIEPNSQSRVLFVDPNPSSNIGATTPDELTISVELKTLRKERTAIELKKDENGKIKTYVSTGTDGNVISFINGTKLNGENQGRSLTTHYTELGTTFNETNEDLETLGIKDIQIEFNTAQAPMVKINFVDVRGKLFEMNNNSPYNVFFELPFPIFELTVKGYYGGPVTYKLHLIKFNGSFNSSNGTFEIKCEFVGYTYAFLSDILIAYIKAIPYTEKGSVIVNNLNSKDDVNFLTLDELDEGIQTFQQNVNRFKKESVIGSIAKADKKIGLLENFRNSYFEVCKSVAGGEEKQISPSSENIFLSKGPFTPGELKRYYDFLDKFFNGDGNENDTLDDYKLDINSFKIIDKTNLFKNVKKSDFFDSKGAPMVFEDYKKQNDGREIKPAQKDINTYSRFFDRLNGTSVSLDVEIIVFDFKGGVDAINDTITKLRSNSADRINELGAEFNKQIKESFKGENFNSSIGDFFKTLCEHVDIFMDVLRDVAFDAEKQGSSPSRENQLINLISDPNFVVYNNGETNIGLGSVKAFPEYRSIEKGEVTEMWIGNKAPNMPEVKFVEDLLNAIIKRRQRDKELENILDVDTSAFKQWYPINPFDIMPYNKKNPYEVVGETGKGEDIIRLLIERLFILDGYGNKHLTNNERIVMAKLEANNAFNSIKNSEIKAFVNGFGLKPQSTKGSTTFIIEESSKKNGRGKSIIYNNYIPNSKLLTEDKNFSTVYTYNYILENISGKLKNGSFLPLNTISNNKDDYNGNFLMTEDGTINGPKITKERLINLRSSGYIFFGNNKYFIENNKENNIDNGATYIDIIDYEKYNNYKFTLPSYGNSIIKEKSPNKENTINSGGIKVGANGLGGINIYSTNDKLDTNLFNGKAGITEILSINGKPTVGLFFKEPENTPFLVKKEINKNIKYKFNVFTPNNKSDSLPNSNSVIKINDFFSESIDSYIPYIGFYSDTQIADFDNEAFYSLFGSDIYYQQDDKGKAFLMLNCLPFNVSDHDSVFGVNGLLNEDILSLFNERAAFVNVPYVWILLIGGYINRFKSEYIKFFNNDFSFIPQIKKNDFPKKDEIFGFRENNGNLIVVNQFEKLDRIINNLPKQVKDKFDSIFINFTESDEFKEIKDSLEIFPSGFTSNDRYESWVKAYKASVNKQDYLFDKNSVINEYDSYGIDFSNIANFINNLDYTTYGKESKYYTALIDSSISFFKKDNSDANIGSPFNFHLELKPNSKGSSLLVNLIRKSNIIVNSTWTIWNTEFKLGGSPILDVAIDKTNTETYLNAFNEEFTKLYDEEVKNKIANDAAGTSEAKKELFNSLDSDDIKLNIYKKLKLIYDKWICGSHNKYEGVDEGDLFKTFKFIDRSYNDISKTMLINPVTSLKYLNSSYNQSFYSFTSKVLSDNNMDFFALPTYINFNDVEEMKKVFNTYPYNNKANIDNVRPSFVCMYGGQRSNNLDLEQKGGSMGINKKPNFKNDGVSIKLDGKGNLISETIPIDMQKSSGDVVPIFLVNYAADNQSIFKNIGLDQAEFTATDESLIITDSLVNNRGIGQNLFDIYNSRSYSANIEMMGNVMIQPLMYFQLSNIPMFHGLYTIIRVSHSITPNSMTTNFTGYRIREAKTKMVDASTIFVNIIGSLSDIDITNASLNGLGTFVGGKSKSGDKINELSKYVIHQLGSSNRGIKAKSGADDFCLFPVREFLIELGLRWNKLAITNPNKYPSSIIYNDISKRLGERDYLHGTHDNGLAIDIRLFNINPKDYETGGTEINSGSYSREVTRDFFKILTKLNSDPRWTTWKKLKGNRSPIEIIFFNDQLIIDEFTNTEYRIGKESGHDNHIHIKFNIPDKYLALTNDPNAFIEEPITINTNNDLSKTLVDIGYSEESVEHIYAYFIGKKEGYLTGGPKSAPVRNNNPGNLTGVSEFKDIDPNVTVDGRFAKFSTLESGTKALVQKKIIKWANGKYPPTQTNGSDSNYQNTNNVPQSVRGIAGKNIELTFEQFTYIYAPPHENNTEKYINSIISSLNAQGINVSRTSKIKDYLSAVV